MGVVTKKDLTAKIASATGQTKAQSEQVLTAILDSIKQSLVQGDDVTLVGFGTFTTKKTAARVGRNPSNGEKINIAAKTSPKFRPGKALKEAVNQ